MKHHSGYYAALAVWAVVAGGLSVAGCSTAQTDKLVTGLGNFNRGVAAVDQTIQTISTALYKNCTSMQAVGQAAYDITGTCTKASPVVSSVNTAINSMCQASQVVDITSTVVASAQTFSAVKSQLSAAKASCAKGS